MNSNNHSRSHRA